MKKYSWNVSEEVVAVYWVSLDEPTNPTAENYRFDIKYSEQLRDPEFCAVEFFDVDKNDWSVLAGSLADTFLYNLVIQEPGVRDLDYLYYTLENENRPVESEGSMIDVTPTQGEQDVPKLT